MFKKFLCFYKILTFIIFNIFFVCYFIFSSNLYAETNTSYNSNISAIHLNVVGSKSSENPKEYNKNSIIIDKEDFINNNYESVYNALEHTHGVNIGKSFKDVIDIRGQGESARRRVKVLYNDVPLNLLDNTHYFPGYNIFKTQSIEKIEVIPGGGSIIYGNGTQGGVVNILTNFRERESKAVNYIYTGFASYNTHRFGASLGKNSLNNKLFFQLDYNGENNRSYLRKEYAITDYYSIATKINLTENNTLGYSYSYYTEEGLFSGVVSKKKLKDDFRASGRLYPRNRKQNFHLLTYQANYLDNTLLIDNISFYNNGSFSRSGGNFNNSVVGDKLKTKILYDNNNLSSLLLGSDLLLTKQNVQPSKGNPFIYEKDTVALFILNKSYYNNLYSTQGYRINYDHWIRNTPIGSNTNQYGNTYNKLNKNVITNSFNFGIGLDYTKNSSVWTTLETGYSPPDASSLTNKENGVYVPAKSLKYENYTTIEAGTEHTIPTTNTYLRGVVFYTYTHNEITRTGTLSNTYSINIGNTSRKGIEISAEQYLYDDIISVSLGFTGIDARFEKANSSALDNLENNTNLKPSDIKYLKESLKFKEGKKLDKVPNYTIDSTIKLKLTSTVYFAANFNYISSHIADFLEYYEQKEREKVQGKVITNLSLNFNKNNLNLAIGINNLTNSKYFILHSQGGNKSSTVTPAMGRNYFFNLRFKF